MIRASVIILLLPGLAYAQYSRISPADPVKNGLFGHAVDLDADGTIAIVGSPGANIRDDIEDFSGTAYVFIRDGEHWFQHAKLVPTEIDRNDAFGSAVALSGDGRFAVVGAPLTSVSPGDGYAAGAAYVFFCDDAGSECLQHARLLPPIRNPEALFGISVAVDESGSSVVIGAPGYQTHAGSAWLFTRSGQKWSDGMPLQSSALEAYSSFGWSVATNSDGSVVWVGSPLASVEAESRGAVHVFSVADSSVQLETVLDPEAEPGAMFGYDVTLTPDASFGLVGAPAAGRDGSISGSVATFSSDGEKWLRGRRIARENLGEVDWFGSTVSTNESGSLVVVGAPAGAKDGVAVGRAFVFTRWREIWTPVRELEADSAGPDDRFGYSVALDDAAERVMVGARGSAFNEFDAGLAHTFGSTFLPVNYESDEIPVIDNVDARRDDLGLTVFPNPCRTDCHLSIETAAPGAVRLEVFDLRGNRVASVFEGYVGGSHKRLTWNSGTLSPGVYILRLRAVGSESSQKVIHLR